MDMYVIIQLCIITVLINSAWLYSNLHACHTFSVEGLVVCYPKYLCQRKQCVPQETPGRLSLRRLVVKIYYQDTLKLKKKTARL